MLHPSDTHLAHRRVLVLVLLAVAISLIATAVWIGFSPRPDHRPVRAADVTPVPTTESGQADSEVGTGAIRITSDAEQFSRHVALAIFTWDTRTLSGPVELVEPFMAVADPTGESSAGLSSDLSGYLPTVEAWADLRQYQTRQWLTVTTLSVPDLWATAVEQAGDGELLPGTTAYTVHGIRHRAGVWEGESVTSEHDVAFTLFVVCGPSYPECHLLRLSRLDDPLK